RTKAGGLLVNARSVAAWFMVSEKTAVRNIVTGTSSAPSGGSWDTRKGAVESIVKRPLVEQFKYPVGGPAQTRTRASVRSTSGTVQRYVCVPLPAVPFAIRSHAVPFSQSSVQPRSAPDGDAWSQMICSMPPPVQSSPPVGDRSCTRQTPARKENGFETGPGRSGRPAASDPVICTVYSVDAEKRP